MKDIKYYFKKAQKEHWAIGQFNFSTIEQLRGILEAAKETKSPVILGTSEGESKFLGPEEILALVEISKSKHGVSAFLNLDHGKDLDWIKRAIDLGYSAVHFDGSDLSLERNMEYTKKIADYAHKKGVLVEGELGWIGGESKFHKDEARIEEKNLTKIEEVELFVKKTGVDSLAVSIGNIHGVYQSMPKLDFERLAGINRKSKAFLVLHGGSGISNEEIKKAVECGINKINFNTELRLVWRESLLKVLQENQKEIRPYKILPQIQISIQKKVEEKISLLNCKNKV